MQKHSTNIDLTRRLMIPSQSPAERQQSSFLSD